jgi:AcrR family transcriptional regulator
MSFSGTATAARPQQLVASTRDLANENGSAAFTVAQVTERSGLSLKAFYQSFESKDDLLIALLREDTKVGAEVLAERIGGRAGTEAVHAYVTELFALLTIPGALGYAGVLVREYLRLVEHHQEELADALRPLTDLLALCLGTPQKERNAITMFGVLLGGIHEVVVGGTANPQYLFNFCMHGVGQ